MCLPGNVIAAKHNARRRGCGQDDGDGKRIGRDVVERGERHGEVLRRDRAVCGVTSRNGVVVFYRGIADGDAGSIERQSWCAFAAESDAANRQGSRAAKDHGGNTVYPGENCYCYRRTYRHVVASAIALIHAILLAVWLQDALLYGDLAYCHATDHAT